MKTNFSSGLQRVVNAFSVLTMNILFLLSYLLTSRANVYDFLILVTKKATSSILLPL